MDSEDEKWKKIGECLKRNSMFTYDSVGFLKQRTYKKAFIGSDQLCDSYRSFFRISDDFFFSGMASIAIRKSFCCKKRLDDVLHRIIAFGLYDKFESDVLFFSLLDKHKKLQSSFEHDKEQSEKRSLTLQDLSGAFLCLMTGHMFASTAFVMEMFSGKYKNQF